MINMLTETTFKRLFYEHEKKMQRINEIAEKTLINYHSSNYELVGILNIFEMIPSFVIPIFVRCSDNPEEPDAFNKQFYFQVINNESNSITCFLKLDFYIENARSRVVRIDSINSYCTDFFSTNSSPLYAFQTSENNIWLDDYSNMKIKLKTYQTDNELLKKEIQDFLNLESINIWSQVHNLLKMYFPNDSEHSISLKVEALKDTDFSNKNLELYILKFKNTVLRVSVCTTDNEKKAYFSTPDGELLENLLIDH